MFFSGGLIPTFLVVTALGGYGEYWAMILPSAVSVFNILVMRGFFASTAPELIDAARMDGAGEWRILWSVVLPTSRAVTAVITLFYAVGYWNSFFNALLYLPDNGRWPLQMILYTYTLQGSSMPGGGVTGTGQYAGHQQIAPLSLQMAVVTAHPDPDRGGLPVRAAALHQGHAHRRDQGLNGAGTARRDAGAAAVRRRLQPRTVAADVWDEDVRLMRDAGVNLVTVGVFAWAALQPAPDRFTFDWLDTVLGLLHDGGIGVALATPTASPPPWLGHRAPRHPAAGPRRDPAHCTAPATSTARAHPRTGRPRCAISAGRRRPLRPTTRRCGCGTSATSTAPAATADTAPAGSAAG